jgi:superfamily II DNA helicase RecQ
MQLRFFTIPIHAGEDAADELNRFLAGHRILAVERQFNQNGGASAWAVCVAFESASATRPETGPAAGRRGKVDYREVLSEQDFSVYARLRVLRKELADAEGVPAYALFTNEQMAEMVTRRLSTAAALREIPGIGEARIGKYGEHFLRVLAEAFAEQPPINGGADAP